MKIPTGYKTFQYLIARSVRPLPCSETLPGADMKSPARYKMSRIAQNTKKCEILDSSFKVSDVNKITDMYILL